MNINYLGSLFLSPG